MHVPLLDHVRVHGVPGAELRPLLGELGVEVVLPPGAEGRLRLPGLQQRPVNGEKEGVILDIFSAESAIGIFHQKLTNKTLHRKL